MSGIRKRRMPFYWTGATFTIDATGTLNLATHVYNPFNRALTYSALDALPSGVTLNGSTLTSVAAVGGDYPVRFRITDGSENADVSATVDVNALAPDTTAPSVPTGLAAATISASQINLTWQPSTDPVGSGQIVSGVANYRVYRDGTLRTTVTAPTTAYSDTGLSASTGYQYTVAAVDVAGNASAQSAVVNANTSSGGGDPLFFDDFNYTLPRVQTWTTKRATLIAATAGQSLQYSDFKDSNRSAGANGYIYTTTSITGSTDPIPGASGRALVLEAFPSGAQTDFWVNIGDSAFTARSLPADCWIQYWFYINRHGAEMSDFTDLKFLYPMFTTGSGTTSPTDVAWLMNLFNFAMDPVTGTTPVVRPETGAMAFRCQAFASSGGARADIVPQRPDNEEKMHPYLSSDIWLRPNYWYLIRHRLNTSGANGQWQLWWRRYGEQGTGFVQRADYTVGTPSFGFSWATAAGDRLGAYALKIPTVYNGTVPSWIYLADLAIADSAAALPTYGSY